MSDPVKDSSPAAAQIADYKNEIRKLREGVRQNRPGRPSLQPANNFENPKLLRLFVSGTALDIIRDRKLHSAAAALVDSWALRQPASAEEEAARPKLLSAAEMQARLEYRIKHERLAPGDRAELQEQVEEQRELEAAEGYNRASITELIAYANDGGTFSAFLTNPTPEEIAAKRAELTETVNKHNAASLSLDDCTQFDAAAEARAVPTIEPAEWYALASDKERAWMDAEARVVKGEAMRDAKEDR